MKNKLAEKNVAVVVTDDVGQSDLRKIANALKTAGVAAHIVSLRKAAFKALNQKKRSNVFEIEAAAEDADSNTYDAWYYPAY